jgi:16S rRNA G966 N2-methylase RsmD
MKMTEYFKWKMNPSKGEVFTPIDLVSKILDNIPEEVWVNPMSTFLDPCMGKGTFLLEIVRRLVYIYGYTEEDAKSRVYGYDIRVKYVNHLTRRGFKNLRHKDFLKEIIKMEFDVVLGNPPYQLKVGDKKTEPLWNKFFHKSLNHLKEGGYLSLIHPSGWRNIEGKFSDIKDIIKKKKLHYLSINNEKKGLEIFGAETRFDYYLLENTINDGILTKIYFQDGTTDSVDLNTLSFIPNGSLSEIKNLVAKEGEEKVNLLYSRSAYGTDKNNVSKIQDNEFIHRCVYTVNYLSQPTFHYSNTNENGHFGMTKVIWSNGRISSVGSYVDMTGEFGLTQFSYAIVDDVENLPNIKRALDSPKFKKLMELCAVGQLTINHKVISTFRKDFWRDFIND